ncbi:hypothetical protein EK21DRAFT_73866, partial [Setomelanomma holmii]
MHISKLYFERSPFSDSQDRSSSIRTATWAMLAIHATMFVARQAMKATVFRKVALDDLFALSATVSALGLSITTLVLADEGLGVLGYLTIERAKILMKGYYASEFLYLSSICFSKLSLLVLLHTVVTLQRLHRRLVLGLGAVISLWSIASLVAINFQCELPWPWEMMTLRCFNTRAFWVIYCIMDISTELCMVMLSVNLVAYSRTRLMRKVAVGACFAPRALVVAASLVRIIWLYPITPHTYPEYRLWLPAILTQVHVCTSISTAYIPYMIPVFRSFDHGLPRTNLSKNADVRTDDHERARSSSLWARRQQKQNGTGSWKSVVGKTLKYERVSQKSPHNSTPGAMTPLTP